MCLQKNNNNNTYYCYFTCPLFLLNWMAPLCLTSGSACLLLTTRIFYTSFGIFFGSTLFRMNLVRTLIIRFITIIIYCTGFSNNNTLW